MSTRSVAREPRCVEQPIEKNEVAIEVSLDHTLDVELNERRLGEACGVSQEPQKAAIGRQAPEGLGAVEILLNRRVRAAPASGAALVEIILQRNDVNRRGIGIVASAVRNEERLAARLCRSALHDEVVESEQQLEEWDHPVLACECRGALARSFATPLKRVPEGASVGECGLRLIDETAPPVEAEVCRTLAFDVAARDAVEQIRREEPAFYGDGRVRHQPPLPVGTRT